MSHIKELEKKANQVELLQKEVVARTWGVHQIQDNDIATKFYTGFPSFAVLLWLYK